METPNELLVTQDEHDNGCKEIEVTFRSGKKSILRLVGPPHRMAVQITLQLAQGNSNAIVAACLADSTEFPHGVMPAKPAPHALPAEDAPPAAPAPGVFILDRLTPTSGGMVEAICFELTFGAEYQKKMLAQFRAKQATSTTPAAPK